MTKHKENPEMDKMNNERVITTRKRVAHAMRLLNVPSFQLTNDTMLESLNAEKITKISEDIAHAVNLLEAGVEEMKWACEWFEWDSGVCDMIDDAVAHLGIGIARLIGPGEDDIEDLSDAGYCVKDAMVLLSKALATLVRWFDDDADVSEV